MALALAVENWTNQGLWLLSRGDAAYPRQLKARLGRLAPPILFGAGVHRERIASRGLAMVGARDADAVALDYTTAVATACAEQGIPVVSGGARGVDTTSMEAALAAGGAVVGMLADSLARASSSRRYRKALLDGQLILLSPFNPQAGFNAGNAMARNKYIYALADWALVVSSALGEGGTWAGATEALLAGRTPVFARIDGDVPEANRRLIQIGALAFPEASWANLAQRLGAAVAGRTPSIDHGNQYTVPAPSSEAQESAQLSLVPGSDAAAAPTSDVPWQDEEPVPASPTPATPGSIAPTTVFDAVWPLLVAHLQEPSTAQALAAALDVRPAQIQDWLDRGVREGRLRKKARPARYVVQPSLFEEQGAR